ncbi:SRPBCC family protein [Candidatus Poribacteria bacterium]|nr:SRPBCC family protein [Candidatus Poribacteria bacterium]MYA71599.1 SRPBCC family protein [Candidatus Poribacteria bacterium]MYH82661.1 SRPBCC family protein [Candidatus Poribacteria bacterium]MYK93131.1 SRPBCC family protein [Candidatus Poribacteria bacterium]
MKTFLFESQRTVECPLTEVFEFFSNAHNLAAITPPELHLEILTPAPIEMFAGTLIDYRLKLHGIPLRWQTEITEWNPPHFFLDEQRRGPYRLWRHTHTFDETGNGVVVGDSVEYAVWGGGLINKLFVRPDIEKIFAYRSEQLDEIFRHKKNSTLP